MVYSDQDFSRAVSPESHVVSIRASVLGATILAAKKLRAKAIIVSMMDSLINVDNSTVQKREGGYPPRYMVLCTSIASTSNY